MRFASSACLNAIPVTATHMYTSASIPPARAPIESCVFTECVGSTKGPNTAKKKTKTFGFTMAIKKPAMNPPCVVNRSGKTGGRAVIS